MLVLVMVLALVGFSGVAHEGIKGLRNEAGGGALNGFSFSL